MKTTQVVCVSSRHPEEPYYRFDIFLKSVARVGARPITLGMEQPFIGLMSKPNHFRKWLRDGNCRGERIILCDAWDIIFTEHPDSIGERCAALYGDSIAFNGEKGCWPRADLAEHFPDTGTPWRYLNSGFMCGPADRILALLEAMDLESIGLDRPNPAGGRIEPNDQGEFQRMFVAQPVPMVVDGKCEVAQTFSGCTPDEFEISAAGVVNKLTGTRPGCLHFNGGSKNDILPIVMNALGL